jgi:ABC-type transporter MlaC component
MSRAATTIRRIALTAAISLAAMTGVGPVPGAFACQEGQLANEAGAAFLKAARSASPKDFASALSAHTDMQKITLFALGKYRSQLPPARQSQLVKLTTRYVSTTLADFALKFRGSAIKTIECKPGQVISRLEFLNKPAKRVLWRFNGSKVVDVNVQNVWLAQLLRDNYASIIQKGGGKIDALFAHLGAREKEPQG